MEYVYFQEGTSAKVRKKDLNESIAKINDESDTVTKKRTRENKKKKMRRIRGVSASSDNVASSVNDQGILASSDQEKAMETQRKEKVIYLYLSYL